MVYSLGMKTVAISDPISSFILGMIGLQDRAVVIWNASRNLLVCDLSSGAISNDLE